MRIPGLASGMDIESMVNDMLIKEKEKVDKAKQEQDIMEWKQELYRDIITDTKNLYDKYLSISSPNSILSDKNYSNMVVNSSNSNVISATSNPGADNINYEFNITQNAEPPKFSVKLDENKTIGEQYQTGSGKSTLSINGKEIEINATDKVSDVVDKINNTFEDGSVKAKYSEMTGELIVTTNKTGESSTLDIKGTFLRKMNIGDENIGINVKGKNLQGEIKDLSGNILKTLNEEENSFTIDNITYTANSIGKATLTSVKDTKAATENMKAFIDDYNKLMDKVYKEVTEKTAKGYEPLTEEQRKEMSEDEIKRWEEKAKEGILRNDSDLRRFVDEMQNAVFGSFEMMGISLGEMGISTHSDYNKKGQISFDEEKFSKALSEKGDLVYDALTKSSNDSSEQGIFEQVKDVVYKYSGSSTSIFAKKAGIQNSPSDSNNIFSNEIKKQEENIKDLIRKMDNREEQLYAKFAAVESTLNKYNAQMSYFMSSTGY